MPRRTVYYRAVKAAPKVQEHLVGPEALSGVSAPDQRWATDLCRVWAGRDGWQTLALVIDCHTRELLGWQLSRSLRATTATPALEQVLIACYGCLGRLSTPFLMRSDNGLVERLIRTLKEQCVHRHRLETHQHSARLIDEWVRFSDHRHPIRPSA